MGADSGPATIARRSAIIIALIDLFVIALAGWMLHESYYLHRNQAVVASNNIAEILDQNIAGTIDRIDLALSDVAYQFKRNRGRSEEIDSLVVELFGHLPDAAGMGMADSGGDVRFWTGSMQASRVNIADRDYFKMLRDTPAAGLAITKPVQGRITGKWQIAVVRRLDRADGSFAGVVYAVITVEHLSELFSRLDVGPQGAVVLRDGDFDLIARHPGFEPGGRLPASAEFHATVRGGNPLAGTYRATAGPEQTVKTISYRKVGRYPLYVIIALADDDWLADWRSTAFKLAVMVGLLCAGTLAMARQIQRSWSHTAALLRDTQTAKARFQAVLENSPAGLAIIGSDRVIGSINAAAARIFNVRGGDVIGHPASALFGSDVQWAEINRRADAQILDGRTFHEEKLVRRPDGSDFWCRMRFSLVDVRDPTLGVAWVTDDISEWVESRERLKALVSDLDSSNRELEQFAYVASHDLREPLRMVSSYVALLERRYCDCLDSEGREFLGYAREGAQRMDGMVLDLLEFSRVGRKGEALAPVSLAEVIDAAIHNLMPTLDESAAKVAVAAGLPTVKGARGELVRLFQNLIGNALKYRHRARPPAIAIGVGSGDGNWVLSVADNGIGIEAEYFDRIFDIFQRLHTRAEYDGTGIGLAICRKIVERHGGRIWVESCPEVGSTFRFTLPRLAMG